MLVKQHPSEGITSQRSLVWVLKPWSLYLSLEEGRSADRRGGPAKCGAGELGQGQRLGSRTAESVS